MDRRAMERNEPWFAVMMRSARTLLVSACAGVLLSGPAVAQTQFLPDVRYFRTPFADPNAPRMSVGVQRTDLLTVLGGERPSFQLPDPEDSATDYVAAIALGAVFPLVTLGEWPGGGAILYLDGRVFGRFRLEYEERDDMGQDWFVGGGVEAARGAWSGRAAIMHRSSHLGDEFVVATGAQRIEFGTEQLDVLAAYQVPSVARVYAGGSWVFRSYLSWLQRAQELGIEDRAVLQVGADREWRPWRDQRFAVTAGVDVQAAERTDWEAAFAAAVGVGVRTRRALRVVARFYDGPSTMSQFFLTPERYFTLELAGEL